MTTPDIVTKLNNLFAQGLTREADVTYLLVQLGKLLERHGLQAGYPVVAFYRNWVAHERLDRPNANPAMGPILVRFAAVAQAVQAGNLPAQVIGGLGDSISLAALKDEIDRLLAAVPGFDIAAIGPARGWQRFDDLLLGILADIPLNATPAFPALRSISVDPAVSGPRTLTITPTAGPAITILLT